VRERWRYESSQATVRWIWLVFEDPHCRLLFCFGIISIVPRFVTRDDLRSFETLRLYFSKFLCSNPHEPSFEQLSNCARSNEIKPLLLPGVYALSNVCWWKKRPRMPPSHSVSHDDLALSVYALHQCSPGTTTVFGRPSSSSERRPRFNSLNQFAIGWCSIAIQRLKFIDAQNDNAVVSF